MNQEDQAKALFFAGLDCSDAGDFAGAERHFREALALVPERASVLGNLAAVVLKQGRPDEALALAARASALNPENAAALAAAAAAERALGRLDAALAAFDRLVAFSADDAGIWAQRGDVLAGLARWQEALASYDRALALSPDYAAALVNRGNVLRQLGRPHEALASYDRALAVQPDFVDLLSNRGLVLHELHRPDEALADYERALSLQPEHPDVLANRGIALHRLRRLDAALDSLDRALALRPDYAEALNSRGVVLQELSRPAEALPAFDRALALRPDYGEALHNRGMALIKLERRQEALASFERALAVEPKLPHAFSSAADCVLHLNDWQRLPQFAAALAQHVSERRSIVDPFVLLGYSGDPALQLRCAETYAADKIPVAPPALWRGERWRNERIRVAYHVARLPRSSAIVPGCRPVRTSRPQPLRDDRAVARPGRRKRHAARAAAGRLRPLHRRARQLRCRDRRSDPGHGGRHLRRSRRPYRDSRAGVFAARPAPVQVNYLGFPATMGAPCYDYIIGDRVVMPEESRSQLRGEPGHPAGLLSGERRSPPLAAAALAVRGRIARRGLRVLLLQQRLQAQAALSSTSGCGCCSSVPGSVLWLVARDAAANDRLRAEAHGRRRRSGAADLRPAAPLSLEHLARFQLADLFLDTIPYNGGATTSDALWCGVPVVTCAGEAFASRMAAVCSNAVGMPELAVGNLDEYEALALRLAQDPAHLNSLKAHLAERRSAFALFDTVRFTRNLEAAYVTMWETWQRGEPPRSFAVSAIAAPP